MTEHEILYGDGTGRPLGLFANQLSAADRAALLHPGHMTRQRRRADARRHLKGVGAGPK